MVLKDPSGYGPKEIQPQNEPIRAPVDGGRIQLGPAGDAARQLLRSLSQPVKRLIRSTKESFRETTISIRNWFKGIKVNIEKANWAQKTFSNEFSKTGKFSGQTVDDVASLIKSGNVTVKEVPIDVVVRNGQTIILNTRSSAALTRAGIPRSQWNVVNRTGNKFYEELLTNQLKRNNLPETGTNIIRQSNSNRTLQN